MRKGFSAWSHNFWTQNKMATSFQKSSRFAVLELDDDSDTETNETTSQKTSNAAKNAKKRARKKKKAAENAANTNELRNLAFSKPVSAKAIQHIHEQRHVVADQSTISQASLQNNLKHAEIAQSDIPSWEEWKSKDEEYVMDQFQKDLQMALRLSEVDSNQIKPNDTKNVKKKTSKKQMSLEEFSKLPTQTTEKTFNGGNEYILNTQPIINGYRPDEVDPNYYQIPSEESPHNDITTNQLLATSSNTSSSSTNKKRRKKKKSTCEDDKSALKDILTELHKDEEEKVSGNSSHNIVTTLDPASLASWQDTMEKKDAQILELKEEVDVNKAELLAVKKRNKQLCFIIGQGEMKDISEVLLQVDELTNIKNELSEELAEMHILLEQERTKVSALKQELVKNQASRTKSKSTSEDK